MYHNNANVSIYVLIYFWWYYDSHYRVVGYCTFAAYLFCGILYLY